MAVPQRRGDGADIRVRIIEDFERAHSPFEAQGGQEWLCHKGVSAGRIIFCGAELPEDLAEHGEQDRGVGSGEVEAMDETADFIFGRGSSALSTRSSSALAARSSRTLPAGRSGVRLHVAAGA